MKFIFNPFTGKLDQVQKIGTDVQAYDANIASLLDDSMVDALHRHSELSASDGSPSPALMVDGDGDIGAGTQTPSHPFGGRVIQIYNVDGNSGFFADSAVSSYAMFMMGEGAAVKWHFQKTNSNNFTITESGVADRFLINAGGFHKINGGLNVGGTIDPGDNNLRIEGTGYFGSAVNHDGSADIEDSVNVVDALNKYGVPIHFFLMPSSLLSSTVVQSLAYETEEVTTTPQQLTTIPFKSGVIDADSSFVIQTGTIISTHLIAKVTSVASTKPVVLHTELYYVDSDGTSNPVQIGADSGYTSVLAETAYVYSLHIHVSSAVVVPAGKRLWLVTRATTTGAEGNPTVHLGNGSVQAHVSVPTTGMERVPHSTIDLTGGQIAFPATAVPSADPNTLDDYEEGYFTAVLTCGTSGTITMNATYDTLSYTKNGREVTLHGNMIVTSVSSPLGALTLTLPFGVAELTESAAETAGAIIFYGINALAAGSILIIRVMDNALVANILEQTTTVHVNTVADHIKAGTQLMININYPAS